MFNETLADFLRGLPLQDFPESLVMAMAAFAFLRLPLEGRKILLVAVLQAFTNAVRLLPIAFGMHTVILTISLAFYVRLVTGARLSRALWAVILCVLIALGLELLYFIPLQKLSGLSYERIVGNPALRGLFSLPYEVTLLILALIVDRRNRRAREQAGR